MRSLLAITFIRAILPLAPIMLLSACGSCEEYASQYSCDFVIKKANYDVYYWRNVSSGNESDNRYIGSTVGLEACKGIAMAHASAIGEEWNERAYVCGLMKDGNLMEKHRLL